MFTRDEDKARNDERDRKLKDPDIQKQLEPLLEELRKKNELEKKLCNMEEEYFSHSFWA